MAHLYKHKVKFLPVFMAAVLIFGVLLSNVSLAATIITLSDTMTDNTKSTFPNHTILFRLSSTGNLDAAGDKIIMTFPSDFDFSAAAIGDVTLKHGSTTSVTTTEVLAAAASASDWGAAFSGTLNRVLTLTAPTDGTGAGAVANSDYVQIVLTSTGGDEFKNATTAGSFTVTLATQTSASAAIDSGSFAIPIIDDGTVDVTATVDPTITMSLSATTCTLGTLSSANKQTCQYNLTASTNATGGYIGYIKDNGNLLSGTDDINDVADAAVTTGSEEYGVANSDSTANAIRTAQGGTELSSGDCTTADNTSGSVVAAPLTTTNQTFTISAAPVSSDVTTFCHSASITATTPAGSYSSIATITVAGNF